MIRHSPGGASGEELACQGRRLEFDPWVGQIPWRRAGRPAPVLLPGESHGHSSLAGCSPWGCRVRRDWAEQHTAQSKLSRLSELRQTPSFFLAQDKCGVTRGAWQGSLLRWPDRHTWPLPGTTKPGQQHLQTSLTTAVTESPGDPHSRGLPQISVFLPIDIDNWVCTGNTGLVLGLYVSKVWGTSK